MRGGDRDDLGGGKKASGRGVASRAEPRGAHAPQERLRTDGEADDVVRCNPRAPAPRRHPTPEGGIVVAYEVAVPSLSEAEAVSSTISSTTVEDVDAADARSRGK